MSAKDCVDAALAGLDAGETVTLPSVEDPDLWGNFDKARVAMARAGLRRRESRLRAMLPGLQHDSPLHRGQKTGVTDMYSRHDKITKLLPAVTDEVLIMAAKSGDHHAFGELWTRHSKKALNIGCRIMGNQDGTEDVVQRSVAERLYKFERIRWPVAILCVAYAHCHQLSAWAIYEKSARPETSLMMTDDETWQHREIADKTKNVEELYAGHERAERLRGAVSRLQPTLRNVVEIYQLRDQSVKEVADLAGISVGATKSRLMRARKILRRNLVPK